MSDRRRGEDDRARRSDAAADSARQDRERRRDSRRPPRALRIAAGVGLGLTLVSVLTLGLAVTFGGLAPGGIDVPQGEVAVEYDAASETVTVEHGGGASFTGENSDGLFVAVNGTNRGVVALPFAPGDDRVVEDVAAGQTVEVVWVAPSGERRTIATRTVGAGDASGANATVDAG